MNIMLHLIIWHHSNCIKEFSYKWQRSTSKRSKEERENCALNLINECETLFI